MKLPPEQRRARRRERVLRTVAVLPSLATLGNLVCGLGAIYFSMLSMQALAAERFTTAMGQTAFGNVFPTYLALGAYLIVVAMAFDGIDGRLARFTRKTSEFGAQLDSLADIVSFGVAPAMLVIAIAHPTDITTLSGLERSYWRAEWVMAAIYVCCAALRLARFNVENVQDESAHLGFKGLPSPGAACAIVGLVILHQDLLSGSKQIPVWAVQGVAAFMPPFAALIGLLMVSRMRYAHMVNTLLRGKRPFRQVVIILIILLIGLVIQFQLTIAIASVLYALSGLFTRAYAKLTGRGLQSELESLAAPDPLVISDQATEPDDDDDYEGPESGPDIRSAG